MRELYVVFHFWAAAAAQTGFSSALSFVFFFVQYDANDDDRRSVEGGGGGSGGRKREESGRSSVHATVEHREHPLARRTIRPYSLQTRAKKKKIKKNHNKPPLPFFFPGGAVTDRPAT